MSQKSQPAPFFSLKRWSTRDLLILVALSIVVAGVNFFSSALRVFLEASIGVYGNRITMVINIIILFIIPYLIRRPGAALLGAVLSGLIQLPFSPFGLISIVGFTIGGLITEILFATGRYRTYTHRFILIIAVVYNLITLGFVWALFQIGSLNVIGIVGVFVASIVGGLLGGWLTTLIGDGMRGSGVLQSYLIDAEIDSTTIS
ncbi:MAG: ECF transporter S component [Chloroflexota bacterium]